MSETARQRGWRFWLGLAAGILVGVPLLLVAGLTMWLNTGGGQRTAAGMAGTLSGGMVRLSGLHGRFPDRLRLGALQVRDTQSVWLTASGIRVDWSPLALIGGTASVQVAAADTVVVARLPVADESKPKPKPAEGSDGLPVKIRLDALTVRRLTLEAPVAGAAAEFSVTGSADLLRLDRGTVDATLRRTDAPGQYGVHASMQDAGVDARLSLSEPTGGLISAAAKLPALGALGVDGTLAGPWNAAALKLAVAAGPLRAEANGTMDMPGVAANLTVQADAPAMSPAPDVAWQRVVLQARVQGKLAKPVANGTLSLTEVKAGGASLRQVNATIKADTHRASLDATLTGVELPPPNQGLLAAGPATLHAAMVLDDSTRPVTYGFEQALLNGRGEAVLAPLPRGRLEVSLPDLQGLARPSGRDVTGHAGFTLTVARDAKAATTIDLASALDVTGGADTPPAARGHTALDASVLLDGADIVLKRLSLQAERLRVSANGARKAGQVTADWHVAAEDLRDLSPALRGAADLSGQLAGTEQDFAANATLTGSIGTASMAPGPVSFALHATGLPGKPAGHVEGDATLAGAPLALDVVGSRDADQTLHVTVNRANWKSAMVEGAFTRRPGSALPEGSLSVAMTRLDDLRPVLGQALAGGLTATVALPAGGPARVRMEAHGAGLPGTATVGRAVLEATVRDPQGNPEVAGTLRADGVKAGALGGSVTLAADGTLAALALKLNGALTGLAGADATVAAAANLHAPAHVLGLSSLTVDWHGEHVRLAAPARLTFAPVVAVDRLRLVASADGGDGKPATVDVTGNVTPTLGLTVSVADVTAGLAAPFASVPAEGVCALQARLGGTPAAPTGTVTLTGTGLRARSGPARALPAARLVANATLLGQSARVDARLAAGGSTLGVAGSAPLKAGGVLGLRADGTVDLALLDPILTAQGRRVRGTARLAATIGGTTAAPVLAGGLDLTGGEVQDFAQGIHVTAIDGRVEADGRTVRIARFSGKAGGGSIGASGTVGLAGDMPVDIRITADNARPIASDLVSATLDAELRISGQAAQSVSASGRVHVRRADIQVPDKLPASVAVLNVRRPGDKPVPVTVRPAVQVPLDLKLDAPQRIFVRGHGLDVELGGTLRVSGTVAAPQTSGSIELRHGTFSLAGTTLNFSSGDISFNGSRKIDPALNLVATSSSPDVVATLTVGGYASAPTIKLSSVPDRPQDEVLAALLFQQSAASLSPFQLAQIAAALAQISGVGGGGPDPLSRLRKGLGLDRLSVGSSGPGAGGHPTGSSSETSVEAGKYIAPGVFLGAKQGTSGAQTQAEVQIDITRQLKLSTDVGSGTGGNTVGLTYQFQY